MLFSKNILIPLAFTTTLFPLTAAENGLMPDERSSQPKQAEYRTQQTTKTHEQELKKRLSSLKRLSKDMAPHDDAWHIISFEADILSRALTSIPSNPAPDTAPQPDSETSISQWIMGLEDEAYAMAMEWWIEQDLDRLNQPHIHTIRNTLEKAYHVPTHTTIGFYSRLKKIHERATKLSTKFLYCRHIQNTYQEEALLHRTINTLLKAVLKAVLN